MYAFRIAVVVLVALIFPACLAGAAAPALSAPAPRAAGPDPVALRALDRELASGRLGNVDGLYIAANGRRVFEKSYSRDYRRLYGRDADAPGTQNALDPGGPYNYFNAWWHPYYQGGRQGPLHTLQSVTKSITAVVIGVAQARGDFPSLDTPVMSFVDEARVANLDDRKRRMTIRHLLEMTAGLDWHELDVAYDHPDNSAVQLEEAFDWVKFTLDRPMAAEPGAIFNYNSGASQVLAHVFRRATGRDIEEYAVEHLFAPLGIRGHFWKRTPTGLADTEGGLYLAAPDLARVGQLLLDGGRRAGGALVTPAWIAEALAPRRRVRGAVHYGYQWWIHPLPGDGREVAWTASGYGGQILAVVPSRKLVVVLTAWNMKDEPELRTQALLSRVMALWPTGR